MRRAAWRQELDHAEQRRSDELFTELERRMRLASYGGPAAAAVQRQVFGSTLEVQGGQQARDENHEQSAPTVIRTHLALGDALTYQFTVNRLMIDGGHCPGKTPVLTPHEMKALEPAALAGITPAAFVETILSLRGIAGARFEVSESGRAALATSSTEDDDDD